MINTKRYFSPNLASVVFAFLVLPLNISIASSAQLTVVGGQLMEASEVSVNGALYDVSFLDGSCNSLFGGCAASNFAFHTQATATSASQALLDQVFLDSAAGGFDSSPELTNGIHNTLGGYIRTPYTLAAGGTHWFVSFLNYNEYGSDQVLTHGLEWNYDNTFDTNYEVYALWTPATVPEPATVWLFGLALASLGFFSRKKKV